jgi:hypothetical protein
MGRSSDQAPEDLEKAPVQHIKEKKGVQEDSLWLVTTLELIMTRSGDHDARRPRCEMIVPHSCPNPELFGY